MPKAFFERIELLLASIWKLDRFTNKIRFWYIHLHKHLYQFNLGWVNIDWISFRGTGLTDMAQITLNKPGPWHNCLKWNISPQFFIDLLFWPIFWIINLFITLYNFFKLLHIHGDLLGQLLCTASTHNTVHTYTSDDASLEWEKWMIFE